MRAVMFQGPERADVVEVEEPRIEEPTDAVLRVTSAGICGSDLHMWRGRSAAEPGLVFGHEMMGVVERVGGGVRQIREGDRVVLPFNVTCGTCRNCRHGFTSACLLMNPDMAGAAYGYVQMGPYRGGQAEQVRVPFVDAAALKLPGKPHDRWEEDFLLLSDVFPTAYHAAVLARVTAGSTVAVFGAGPVGLLAALSSFLRGASRVYVVDEVPERLAKAEEIGAVAVDFREGDPVEQILEHRRGDEALQQGMRPGEEKMLGVHCGIDAVGYEAVDWQSGEANPARVLEDLVRVVAPTGSLGIIGVYLDEDPGVEGPAGKGRLELPWAELWSKALRVGTGQAPVPRYAQALRDLITAGRATPSVIVTHRLPMGQAPEAYRAFSEHRQGAIKVVLRPDGDGA